MRAVCGSLHAERIECSGIRIAFMTGEDDVSLFAKLTQTLRSARRLELILLVVLIAAAGLIMTGTDRQSESDGIESRLERVLGCIEGAGSVRVAVNQATDGSVLGVIVVAEGASDMRTYLNIQSAVRTFMGIDLSMIEIVGMEDGR